MVLALTWELYRRNGQTNFRVYITIWARTTNSISLISTCPRLSLVCTLGALMPLQ
jgi:hypothetical protein